MNLTRISWGSRWRRCSRQWYGEGQFIRNSKGYGIGAPAPYWSLSGGTAANQLTATELSSRNNQIYLSSIGLGGSTKDGPAQNTSTTKIKLVDSDGAIAENTFSVRWHRQYENYRYISTETKDEPDFFIDKVAKDQPILFDKDTREKQLDMGQTLGKASAWVGVGTAATVILVPASATYVGWISSGGGFLSSALGAAGVSQAPAPTKVFPEVPGYTDYASYKQAVTDAKNGDASKFEYTAIPGQILTIEQIFAELKTPENSDQDKYWMGNLGYHVWKKAHIPWKTQKEKHVGEEYGASGYIKPHTAYKTFVEAAVDAAKVKWVVGPMGP